MSEVFKICITKNSGEEMQDIDSIEVLANKGIVNDRYFNENNDQDIQITFIESENIDYVNEISSTSVPYIDFRRNIITKGINAFTFIKEMDLAYAAADIIVSRAGAIAISELCYVGKPVILVPSPNVAEDHQTQNAQSLVNKNSALMVKDMESRRKLVEEIKSLSENKGLQEKLSRNIKKLAVKDAAGRIADLSLELVK